MSLPLAQLSLEPAFRNVVLEESERALVQRVALGSRLALQRLAVAYHPTITRFFRALAFDNRVVDELTTDTVESIWTNAATLSRDSSVSSWIFRLAYGHALREESESRVGTSRAPGERPTLGPDAPHTGLLLALKHLPLAERVVVELTYHFGHSCEEIAEIMQCSVGSVQQYAIGARRTLRASASIRGAQV